MLVNEPIVPANLLVAIAADGGNPVNKRAGNAIKPPPPTTESIKAARKPKMIETPTAKAASPSPYSARVGFLSDVPFAIHFCFEQSSR